MRGSTPAPALIASHSGLRERPGAKLTPEAITRTIGGFAELLRRREVPATIALARDERPAGGPVARRVSDAAREAGADVVDLGITSTPAAKLAARSRGLGGVVVVTGSHLAPELTGLKLVVAPGYLPVDVRELPEPAGDERAPRAGRRWKEDGATGEHLTAVAGSVDAALIRRVGLRVGVTGGVGSEGLLDALGARVAHERADVGLALDADGDRLELIDEKGTALDPEATFALVVVALDPGTIVKGADTSRMVDDLAAGRGMTVHVSDPGELNLLRAMTALRADVAGEGNGGVVVPAVGLARDGLAAAAAILELIARRGRPLSSLAAELPAYARRRSVAPWTESGAERLREIATRNGSEVGTDSEGGLSVARGEGAWGLVRRSATEPVLRITAEARTEAEAVALHDELRAALTGG